MRTAPKFIKQLEPHQVFVFGSNTEGIHGGGAARTAFDSFEAVWGQPDGLQGKSYAIYTKDLNKGMRSVDLKVIEGQIIVFLQFAEDHSHLEFLVTRFGCELAGFEEYEIGSLFKGKSIPENVLLPEAFIQYL